MIDFRKIGMLCAISLLCNCGGSARVRGVDSRLYITCKEGFIPVPAQDELGTSDFCLASFEMKNVGGAAVSQAQGLPWTNITRDQARTACEASGYKLIENAEWQAAARSIEDYAVNWVLGSGSVPRLPRGSSSSFFNQGVSHDASSNPEEGCHGLLFRNASTGIYDIPNPTCASLTWNTGIDQKRTLKIFYNDQDHTVWDMGGNVWEWVDGDPHDYVFTPMLESFGVVDISDMCGGSGCFPFGSVNRLYFGPRGDFDAETNGMGKIYGGNLSSSNPTGGFKDSIFRGGHFLNSDIAGIYGGSLGTSSTYSDIYMGFRCSYPGEIVEGP